MPNGRIVGIDEGLEVGTAVGVDVGVVVGTPVGSPDGNDVGTCVGPMVGGREGGDVGVGGDGDREGVAGDELLDHDGDGLALLVVCRLCAVLLLRLLLLSRAVVPLRHVHAHFAELRRGLRLRLDERRRLGVLAGIGHRLLRGGGGGRLGAPLRRRLH